MSARPGPAPERGGTPTALDSLRRKSGLKKARSTSVIADMTRSDDPMPTSLQAVPEAPPEPEAPTPTQRMVEAPAAPAHQQPVVEPAVPQPPVQQLQHAQQQIPVQQAAPEQAYALPQQAYVQPAPSAQQPMAYQPAQYQPQQVQLRQPAPEPPAPEKKVYRKTSFFQSMESGSRMRSAYMATRHLTAHRTLSDFILAAVEREVEALEQQYNNGDRFTADPGSVPRGRPLET
jgi:hypothetical protein